MEFCISESLFLVDDVIMLVQIIDGNHSADVQAQLSGMSFPADLALFWWVDVYNGGIFLPPSHITGQLTELLSSCPAHWHKPLAVGQNLSVTQLLDGLG